MLALFLPVFFGMSRLYMWAQPAMVAADPILEYKKPYLNPPFFIVRTLVYFAAWIFIAFLLNRWSREQDRTGGGPARGRMSAASGPAFVVWALFVTGAAIDWVMSLEPHWFSTIYGFLFMVIMGLAALCLCVVVVRLLADTEPTADVIEPKRLNDLGNLMLALVMLWTYMSFSQFLIIWAGNLKDEIPWYMVRAFGPWAYVAVILLLFHFAVPFLALLQRQLKRRIDTAGASGCVAFGADLGGCVLAGGSGIRNGRAAVPADGCFCRRGYRRPVGRCVSGAAQKAAAGGAARYAVPGSSVGA